MRRREVVVGDTAFDLGVEGLEKEVAELATRGSTLELEVGPTVFNVGYLREEKAIAFNWWAETDVQNIRWTRFVFLRWRWPPMKKVCAFAFSP
jgi:hypothetical protein